MEDTGTGRLVHGPHGMIGGYGPTTKREIRAELHKQGITFAPIARPATSPTSARTPATVAAPRERRAQRSSTSTRGSPSDDDPSEPEPPQRRLCENKRCEADISHRPKLARYCDDACQQEAWRDRRTIEYLDEVAGTPAEGLSCVCSPAHNVVEHGHCLKCGYTRGVLTRAWVDDEGVPARLVSLRSSPRKRPRYGDGKRKPVTVRKAVAA